MRDGGWGACENVPCYTILNLDMRCGRMFRKHQHQVSFADADNWLAKTPPNSIWHRFRTWAQENGCDLSESIPL